MVEGVKIKFTQFPDGVSLSLSLFTIQLIFRKKIPFMLLPAEKVVSRLFLPLQSYYSFYPRSILNVLIESHVNFNT